MGEQSPLYLPQLEETLGGAEEIILLRDTFLGEYFFRSPSDFAAFFVGCGIKMVSLAMTTVMSGAELVSQARC